MVEVDIHILVQMFNDILSSTGQFFLYKRGLYRKNRNKWSLGECRQYKRQGRHALRTKYSYGQYKTAMHRYKTLIKAKKDIDIKDETHELSRVAGRHSSKTFWSHLKGPRSKQATSIPISNDLHSLVLYQRT